MVLMGEKAFPGMKTGFPALGAKRSLLILGAWEIFRALGIGILSARTVMKMAHMCSRRSERLISGHSSNRRGWSVSSGTIGIPFAEDNRNL